MADQVQYEIKEINDVLAIDETHIDEFLRDLKDYYEFGRPIYKLGKETGLAQLGLKRMLFKPDGKAEHTINLQLKMKGGKDV